MNLTTIKILVFSTAASLAGSAFADQYDARIEALVSQMTLEEKVGQLNQLSGVGYTDDMVSAIRSGKVGSLLNEVDPEVVNKLQREAVENSRLHIPLVFARDVIHGFRTIFPIPLGQAATWDEQAVELGARVSAEEASSVGVRWTFSPMLDVSRDGRWGRIAESFGEDPLLVSRLGVAMVKGYQGDDLTQPNTMAACAKHFACYGAAESGKDYNTTWVPENLLRDVYLPPFRACADAGSATFMCSFNDINGVPSSGNKYLLRDILRGEWGWNGMMVSDWGSIDQMIPHGYSANLRQAAQQGAIAGVDMDMESHAYTQYLVELVQNGEVPMAVVDDLVRNVLRLKFRLGLFENPYVDTSKPSPILSADNLAASQRTAEESVVMLKNNGILPLKPGSGKVALCGPMLNAQHDQNGTWCFDLVKTDAVTPLTAFTELYGADNVIVAEGLTYSREHNDAAVAAAVTKAAEADVIFFFAGEEAVLSGEAHCRADISLPGGQSDMLRALKATGKPVVLVIQTGRPMTIPEESELADAVLYAFHLGTMAGPALANIVSGAVNPSGHLPVCLPRMVGQLPLYYAHKNTGRPASGITLIDEIPLEAGQTSTGCTAFYLDAGDGPLYPFGYGMSYTTFEYGKITLSSDAMGKDGSITASCTVTNTGSVAGDEVVQLYVRDLVGSLVRPVKELKDFARISLAPGESKTITFTLPASALAYTMLDKSLIVEPGDFLLWIAPDSASGTPVSFKVTD